LSDVTYTWRDSELQAKPLRALNEVGARLSRFGVVLPSLTPSSVISSAVKLAGSSDLGSDSYREPLEVYLAACRNEADLTTFGRILISKMLAASLANRIALHRWSVEHPEVRSERIESPWVIVGLPRTGTSVLSMLLGLDPMARPLLQWEAAHPIPPPTLEEGEQDPRIAQTTKEMDGLMKLNPPLKAMHPFGATLAQECVSLFMYDVRTLALELEAHVPTYARWLEQADMTPAYAQHRLALQTLQSRQPTERWILKTPNHLWHLEALLAAYPDARIVWTHRDPGPVITSLASLANAGQRSYTWRSDPRPTANEWKRKCAFALESAVAFDEKSQDGWCQHLHYDPADFDWTYPGLAEEFSDYTNRYNVRSESTAAT
jgi:Sulfotransferase family